MNPIAARMLLNTQLNKTRVKPQNVPVSSHSVNASQLIVPIGNQVERRSILSSLPSSLSILKKPVQSSQIPVHPKISQTVGDFSVRETNDDDQEYDDL